MRTPLGGRGFECFSEDPVLTARIAVAFITGLQSAGVAATAKHFVGNDSETERWTYDAPIAEHGAAGAVPGAVRGLRAAKRAPRWSWPPTTRSTARR